MREQAELLRDLRLALARGQLELYYQPKIHAPSAQITGAEALLRWHHPQRGMISPTMFIPMAERSGLIVSLGALGASTRPAARPASGATRACACAWPINLSAHQLRQRDLVAAIAARAGLAPGSTPTLLTCEITEIGGDGRHRSDAARLRRPGARAGVHISIDDFGTGYSSLAYLRKLPANELKIDRSFVLDLEPATTRAAIVDAVVKLAQALEPEGCRRRRGNRAPVPDPACRLAATNCRASCSPNR